MNEWRLRVNSACFKGAYAFIDRILILVERCTGGNELVWGLNIFGILNILPCRAGTKTHMDKWS